MAASIDLITGRVAKELGLSPVVVDHVCRSQYKFLVDVMQSGSMSGVSLIYLGKYVKNKRYESVRRDITGIQESTV